MTKPNKPYDTTPCLDPIIQGRYPSSQVYFEFGYVKPYETALSNCFYLTEFLTDFGQISDSKSYDQS